MEGKGEIGGRRGDWRGRQGGEGEFGGRRGDWRGRLEGERQAGRWMGRSERGWREEVKLDL